MKKQILILLICLSCSNHQIRIPASASQNDEVSKKYENAIFSYESLVEEALVWRAKSIEFYKIHEKELRQKNQLPHQAMLDISESIKKYLEIRQRINKEIEKYQFDQATRLKFTPGEGTKIKHYKTSNPEDFADDTEKISTLIKLDPTDDLGKELLIKLKITLSAKSVLYDNYMIGIYPYEKHRKTRRLLNLDNPEYKLILENITDNFFSLNNRIQFLSDTKIFNESEEYDVKKNRVLSDGEKYLDLLINQSPVYQFMKTGKHLEKQPNILRAFVDRIYDRGRSHPLSVCPKIWDSMITG